jgi:hypothetical protein
MYICLWWKSDVGVVGASPGRVDVVESGKVQPR